MKITGFTFIKNAFIYDYPIVEAIKSILPICDKVVVAVGKSDDKTLELIQSIHKTKIIIINTIWDEQLREGGQVLAVETDKAFAAIPKDTDWAFYIQGDEVVHEKYLPVIKAAMKKQLNNKNIDGLLFKYHHFYGSYDYIGASNSWYRNEIRVIRNNPSIFSYKDAQGFRKRPNDKLKVVAIDAYMYHYGWVKEPKAMQAKQENFNKLWHDDQWVDDNVVKTEEFDYGAELKELSRFEGTHPKVMEERIARKNWKFEQDITMSNKSTKDKVKDFFRKYLGINMDYKNYRL